MVLNRFRNNLCFIYVLVTINLINVCGNNNLKVAYQWKRVDYVFTSEAARNESIANRTFIPDNISIHGIEVVDERIFVTVPRYKAGVWSTLNYFYRNDTSTEPKLIPYPNISQHLGYPPDIISPYRLRKDNCGRLWIVDSGLYDYLGQNIRFPPAFHIFNLTTNERILKYTFPANQTTAQSYFANLVLEVVSCDDIFAYFADIESPALVVYSSKTGQSWKINHPYFERNPLAAYYNVAGVQFSWREGLFGMALSEKKPDNYSTLYFGPMTSFDTFEVSTRVLRDPALADLEYSQFKHLGSRGPNSQIGSFAFDGKTNVLIYGMLNRNAVGCWNSKLVHNVSTQGIVYENNSEMITPSDIIIEKNDLWIISNKLVVFMFSNLNYSEYNYRIFKGTVDRSIAGTVCDITSRSAAHSVLLSPVPVLIIISIYLTV